MLNYHAVIIYTNDFERLEKAVNSLEPIWKDLTIIDNSINKCIKLRFPNADVYETPTQFTCSQSFNAAQNIARLHNADVLLMAHGDMEVTNKDMLITFLEYLDVLISNKCNHWGVVFTHYDALVAINMDCADVIGPWDTNITHYPIDIDYYYRIRKYGYEILDFGGDWVDHHASSTIRKSAIMDYLNTMHHNECNNMYYQRKWGGCRDQEQYVFPFNGQDLNRQYLGIMGDPLYSKLLNSFYTEEGSFLSRYTEQCRLAQHSLILNILNAAKPKSIIEIGTHKYFFPLFLSNFIENFSLKTFDIREDCLHTYDIISEPLKKQGIDIKFICGDTKITLNEHINSVFDLAWVDGGHDYTTSFNDLLNIGDMKVPYILVDDTRMDSVSNAVKNFLDHNKNYYLVPNPYYQWDDRGITVLRRNRNA